MDAPPLIQEDKGHTNTAPVLRKSFQDALQQPWYPAVVARNILQNKPDDGVGLIHPAVKVLEIYGNYQDTCEVLQRAENDIMTQQGRHIIEKNRIDCDNILQGVKLKHCKLFGNIKSDLWKHFGLLSLFDLMPDALQIHLNFFYNDKMVCENCLNETHTKSIKEKKHHKMRKAMKNTEMTTTSYDTSILYGTQILKQQDLKPTKNIKVVPSSIVYSNFEVGKKYKRIVRIINATHTLQSIMISQYPKFKYFHVELDLTAKLAAGMSVTATITFSPTVYRNVLDKVIFRNSKGEEVALPITTFREDPQLRIFVLKNDQFVDFPSSLVFSEKRRAALNYTIDCGSCLISEFVLVSLIVQNNGSDAKFFILTEDEWLFQDVEYLTEELELNIGPFWIFPTYFEMRKGDSAEIHLLYQPISPGLHIERLCMICDNNSVQEIEIIGDSLEFSQNIIRVEVDSDSHICQKKHYCLSLGHIEKKARKTLQITIQNESNVVLELGYLFFNKPQDRVHDINKNWIVMEEKDDDWHLLPYATTDLDFDIVMDAQEVGYYSIFFDLFVRNVPLSSLVEDVEMIIYRTAGPVRRTFNQCADVLVAEMEIACYVDTTEEKIEPSCACDPCEHPWQPNLTIVPRYLNFGILPVGLNVEKEFYVQNLTDETMDWKVFEVRYNIDRVPYSEILHQGNCDFNCGQFTNMWEHAKIMYKIIDKPPGNWVSILVLATCENDRIHTVEGICIVTYEVIEYDIVVKTGSSANPIICPMKLMYVDIPTQIKFTVENRSPITACFCLNKPYGTDIDKISLKLSPHSAIMKPNEIVEITAIIQSSEVGIFENTFIPCFFSLAQTPIVIRVLCAVDTLHVFFYLPEGSSSSKKVIWPPKIVYEYGWSLGCPCEAENCLDCASEYLSSSSTLTDVRQYQQSFPSNYMKEHLEYDGCNISTESSVSEISAGGSLVAILKEQFGEVFLLQSNKIEVKVTASKPTSVVIYIENITPIATKFAIEAQNFPAKKNYNPSWTTLKFQKAKYIWNSLIDADHGILVQPDIEHSDLKGFGWIKLNLWIYANTWGIYSEEIIVDIEDTPSFSFALLIDVTGIPIEFPMAKNAITKYPTVRFGYLPYGFSDVNRNIAMVNTSCIPLRIIWHVFISAETDGNEDVIQKFNLLCDVVDGNIDYEQCKLVLTKRGYGKETTEFLKVVPEEIRVQPYSSATIKLELNSEYFGIKEKPVDVTCFIIGSIRLEEDYRKKLSYYYRKLGSGTSFVRLQVLANLELPLLATHFQPDETSIDMYANEVIFEQKYYHSIDMMFRNKNLATCDIDITIDEPFYFYLPQSRKNTEKRRTRKCSVGSLDQLKVTVMCYVDHQKILDLANFVYPKAAQKQTETGDVNHDDMSLVDCIDKDNKVINLCKNLKIYQNDNLTEMVGVHLCIHYPHIDVKPTVCQFGNVVLGTTKKSMVTVFNLTGYAVSFEITKAKTAKEFYFTPHYGRIEGSTGVNYKCVDVFVYFTPSDCRSYAESFRITTDIPNYFIEIPLKAIGTVNEKDDIEYKI